MKHLAVLALLMLTILVLQGCAGNSTISPEQTTSAQAPASTSTEIAASDRISLFGTDGFDIAIHNNPIDLAFDSIYFDTTAKSIYGSNVFRECWTDEINATCKKLYSLLNEEDAKLLRESQENWEHFMEQHFALMQSIFYDIGGYNVANGMLDRVMINDYRRQLARNRALELMEYYYRFTGKIEFEYRGIDFENWPR
jgi:hypothetical protein